jgi:hypothetical protein
MKLKEIEVVDAVRGMDELEVSGDAFIVDFWIFDSCYVPGSGRVGV